ncbi:MAG: hypothetical protein CTY35_07630 [Methylotenera sp.]|nr:MAG: hypothetical protein CTY35_07630 [Methylotenera sp.]
MIRRDINNLMKPLICIAGQNSIAVNGLRLVIERYPECRICYIPSNADKGLNHWQPSLIKKAKEWNVQKVDLEDIYHEEELIFISLQYSEIIKTRKFKSKHLYNLHFSKLPKYKGVYPAIHSIINGESEAGVTLHYIDDGIDTGDIIAQQVVNIEIDDTARDVYIKQSECAFKLFEIYLEHLIEGNCFTYPQPALGASYYSKTSINFSELHFDFNKTAFEIHNKFRALNFREYQMPVFSNWQILKTEILTEKSTQKAGALLEETEAYFVIATIDFDLKLTKDYYPALWLACEQGDVARFNHAVSFIDNLDLRNQHGWNALIIASYFGHVEIVQKLIEHNVNINMTNYKGTTVLMYALSYFEKTGNVAPFKLLIESKPDISLRDDFGKDIKDYIVEKSLNQLLSVIS